MILITEQMMSIEEAQRLKNDAKEHQATTQFKGGMHPVSAEASETDGHLSKEVARKIWKESSPIWKSCGIFLIPIT